jgi:hypothetical protein
MFLPSALAEVAARLVREHQKEYMIPRKRYKERCAFAETHPEEVLHLIIDSMDSNKTRLPHFKQYRVPKNWANYVHLPHCLLPFLK